MVVPNEINILAHKKPTHRKWIAWLFTFIHSQKGILFLLKSPHSKQVVSQALQLFSSVLKAALFTPHGLHLSNILRIVNRVAVILKIQYTCLMQWKFAQLASILLNCFKSLFNSHSIIVFFSVALCFYPCLAERGAMQILYKLWSFVSWHAQEEKAKFQGIKLLIWRHF